MGGIAKLTSGSGPGEMTPRDRQFIRRAAGYLEHPSLLMKLADLAGKPLEWTTKMLPASVQEHVSLALRKATGAAISTIRSCGGREGDVTEVEATSWWTGLWHTVVTGAAGAAGGFFGAMTLPIELPLTTGVMLRAIASVADDFGQDLADQRTVLECLTVLAYGGRGNGDDQMESSYLTSRIAFARLIERAAQYMAGKAAKDIAEAIAKGTAPRIVQLIALVAERFGVAVSQKLVAQAVPVIGAVGGAYINVAFTDHFTTVARFHFGIRKLERCYGVELVQNEYRKAIIGIRRGNKSVRA